MQKIVARDQHDGKWGGYQQKIICTQWWECTEVPAGNRKLLSWSNEYLGLRKDSGGRLGYETSKHWKWNSHSADKWCITASLLNHIEKVTGMQAWLISLPCVRALWEELKFLLYVLRWCDVCRVQCDALLIKSEYFLIKKSKIHLSEESLFSWFWLLKAKEL